jgi:hypothetical protein
VTLKKMSLQLRKSVEDHTTGIEGALHLEYLKGCSSCFFSQERPTKKKNNRLQF